MVSVSELFDDWLVTLLVYLCSNKTILKSSWNHYLASKIRILKTKGSKYLNME